MAWKSSSASRKIDPANCCRPTLFRGRTRFAPIRRCVAWAASRTTRIDPAPQWHDLLDECAERAVEAIGSATYQRVEVRFSNGVARLAAATADGAETEVAYRSAADLALGMKSMGLERLMLRAHRSQADYIADAQQKLDSS